MDLSRSQNSVTRYSTLLTQYVPCGPYGQTRGMRRPVIYKQLWVRNYISYLSLPFRDKPCIQCLVLKSVRMISQRFSEKFSGIEFPSLMNIWDWNWEIFFLCSTNYPGGYLLLSRQVVTDSATPWTAAREVPLSSTISQSLLKFMSIESVIVFNQLILCQPLLLLPPPDEEIATHSSTFARRNPWTVLLSIFLISA